MQTPHDHIFEFNGYRVDAVKRQLSFQDQRISLSPKAFELLLLLIEHQGQVVEKDQLMKRLWPDSFVEEANLNVHISALRKAFGESAQNPRYISTIPARGYRFNDFAHLGIDAALIIEKTKSHLVLTEVLEEQENLGSLGVGQSARSLHRHSWRSGYKLSILALCTIAVVVGLLAISYFRQGSKPDRSGEIAAPVRSIAVLPFKSLGGENEHLSVGMADTLITRLSGTSLLTVRPTNSILQYHDTEREPIAIGEELGVDFLLEGTILREAEDVRVTVRLIGVRDKRVLWGGQFDEKFNSILDVQDTISRKVIESLALKLSEEQQKFLVRRYTNNTEAYQSYLKGRHFWNKRTSEGLRRSIELFHEAVDKDPQYALAYSGLADAYSMLGEHTDRPPNEFRPQARAAALKALELDGGLAEAHASLAYLNMRDWDWANVEASFKRALEINPNYATAHHWYSIFLELTGQPEEALAQATTAQQIDPLSLIINENLGARLLYAGRYNAAVDQLKRTLEIDQNFAQAHHTLGDAYLRVGRIEEAIEEFRLAKQLDDNPWVLASLAHAYAISGNRSEAQRLLTELQRRGKESRVPPEEVARVYVGLGDNEKAFEWLEKALKEHSDHLVFIKVDPLWRELASERRFQNILTQVGL